MASGFVSPGISRKSVEGSVSASYKRKYISNDPMDYIMMVAAAFSPFESLLRVLWFCVDRGARWEKIA
jgi:hypothetical protein